MLTLSALFTLGLLSGLSLPGPLSAGEQTLNIWPDKALPSAKSAPAEAVNNRAWEQNGLGLNRSISQVSQPTFTLLLPDSAVATGAAVVILPGGEFRRVTLGQTDVARNYSKAVFELAEVGSHDELMAMDGL